MTTIVQAIQKGYKVVFTNKIAIDKEPILSHFKQSETREFLYEAGLSADEISKLALSNLHATTVANFATNNKVTYPTTMIWSKEDGLFMHSFQMYPIFVAADTIQNCPIRRFRAIDIDFANFMIPKIRMGSSIFTVTEPQSVILFELLHKILNPD